MGHLDEITIQKYIDNELSSEEKNFVETHLGNCKECSEQVENQRFFAEKVKKSLNGFATDDIVVPEFKIKYRPKKVKTLRIIIISSVSTACAILLTFFIIRGIKSEPENDYIFDFITIEEYDANKPMTEQMFTYSQINNQ